MAEWVGQVRGAIKAVFEDYAVRIAVFLIAWPVFHQILQLPAFDFLTLLNIPLVNDYFVHVRSLFSFGLALLVQRWVHSGLERGNAWVAKRRKFRRLVSDTEPREAAFLLALFRERWGDFGAGDLAQSDRLGPVIGALFPKHEDFLRSLRRLKFTYYLHYYEDRFARWDSAYSADHEAIARNVEALKSHAGRCYKDAERILNQQG